MKSIVMPKTVQLSKEVRDQLAKETTGMLAVNSQDTTTAKKNFTAAEMWNSRRNLTSASSMIRRWNLN